MTENVTASWSLYSIGGSSSVIWTNVNTAKPNWVYIINILIQNQQTYINSFTNGNGISSTTADVIRNVLIKADGTGTCSCYGVG